MNDTELADACVTALKDEAAAISAYAGRGGATLAEAVRLIHASTGPLIVAGIGKSGHIAGKLASTFRSIGKAAIFLHPAEASHGDLGLVARDSVLLILSNSGETTELSDLLHFASEYGNPIIALTGSESSTLSRAARVTIAYGKVAEVCPNGLAPTTSTTLSLAIGDALAVGVTHLLGTAAEDFRRYHPGGKLGAMLLTVRDLMHTGAELPFVSPDAAMSETVAVMAEKALGVALVRDGEEVTGIITDGDMRRNAERLFSARAGDIATPNPAAVTPDMRASDAVKFMTKTGKGITSCVVREEDGRFAGFLHIHDCLRAGVVV
ncbi:KpsF/GutQ family sugar-phosphate isomerase [Ovoidimarina sediminis]|uniref:KpsF/GutQ family sugar-phosphate isomerase n=1 Tax=Ovoidimarina sediminis TaxID=3079856 RepID=UPI00290FB0E9|nr:KpsF/GutQ family sugar-phosphate isomerase [Rhodophyticola sp. MJ-SS7]MDU8943023.1 KpsF/GutQ family sugar-phosphate isomerase [Rhodophyticola sp. MJ-SS7]